MSQTTKQGKQGIPGIRFQSRCEKCGKRGTVYQVKRWFQSSWLCVYCKEQKRV